MTKQEIIDVLAKYRRPGSPMYDHHFQKLPSEIIQKENVPTLLAILNDAGLSPVVRENAAGTLGEIGDQRAVMPLTEALRDVRIRRSAAIALGRMKAREAAEVLKELAQEVKAARWALSQLGVAATVEEVIDDLRSGQLRLIPHILRSLPDPLRKKVEDEIIRQFRDAVSRDEGHEDLRWYVTALTTFQHPDAPALLARTLELSWKQMGPFVEMGYIVIGSERTCCGCLHNRTLRALKTNPSLDAVPNLVETITNRYQRHALMALRRLRELNGGKLSDLQIAEMIKKNAAIRNPIGSQRQHIRALTQLVRFAGFYGGTECKRTLQNLRSRFSESPAQAIENAIRSIDLRLRRYQDNLCSIE